MAANVGAMSNQDRVAEVLRGSKKNFGSDVGQMIDSLLSPTNLALMTGTLVLWAGSHFVGVGEIVDVVLLTVGAFAIGWSITDVAKDLYTFADKTINARADRDLDIAAQAFSHAIVLAGVTAVMAILLRRSVKDVQAARGGGVLEAIKLRNPGLPNVGSDPALGRVWSRPGIKWDPNLPAGQGSTSPFGEVTISTRGSATDQALVRAHELVHRFLTPRFGVLRTFRVSLGMSGYLRSALLRYLEEAIAETVAQLRVNGAGGLLTGIKFPVANGYMLVSDLVCEGVAIGTISAETQLFSVQFIPANPRIGSKSSSYSVEK